MPPVSLTFDAAEHSGSLRVDYAGDTDARTAVLYAPRNLPVKVGEVYLHKFSARASALFNLNILPRQSHPGYVGLAASGGFNLESSWVSFLHPFEITAADTSCRLDFNWGRAAAQFWLDDVALYPMPPRDTALGPRSVLYYNTGSTMLSMNPSPGSTWLDVNGATRSGAVSMQALGAFIAIRDGARLGTPVRNNRVDAFLLRDKRKALRQGPQTLFSGKGKWFDLLGKIWR